MAGDKRENNFIRQGSLLAIGGIITRLIGLLYRSPLTNIVGDDGMGIYSAAYEIYNIALIVSVYSIPVAVSRLVALKDSKGEFINSSRIFKISKLVSSSLGLAASLFLFLFADQLATFLEHPNAEIPLRILAPTIFVFSIMGVYRGFFQGKKTMKPTVISQLVEQIVNAIVSVGAALVLVALTAESNQTSAWGAGGGTLGTLAGAFAGLICLLIIYKKSQPKYKQLEAMDDTGKYDKASDTVKLLLLTMLPIIFSQTIYQISGVIDTKLFGYLLKGNGFDQKTVDDLWGIYSGKYKWLYNVPVAIASAFGVTIVPMLTGLFSNGLMDQVKEKLHSSMKFNLLIAIPSAAGLGFLGGPILQLIFRHECDDAAFLLTFGCLAVVFFAYSTFSNGVLQGIGGMRWPVIHSAISLVIHIPLTIILVGTLNLGMTGMVIANVAYALVICILNYIKISKLLNYRQEIKKSILKPTLCSIIMGAVALFVFKACMFVFGKIFSGNFLNDISTLISIFFAVVIYAFLLLKLKAVNEDDIVEFPSGVRIIRVLKKIHML